MLLNERLKFFSISYTGPVRHVVFKRKLSLSRLFVWGWGIGSLAVIKPDLSRNLANPAAAENYPASRN